MKYIAWYSEKTVYEDIFKEYLEPTLIKYKLDYEAIAMPNYTKWSNNVAQKPLVVTNALLKYKEPIVLLDADCKLTDEPILFNTIDSKEYDIACHYLDWATWYNRPDTKKELLTGTMWFNYNERVLKLCEEWYKICWANKCADQRPIESLLQGQYKDIRVYELPLSYCYINSLPNGNEPHVKVDNPVVTHYQASRTAKRGIL